VFRITSTKGGNDSAPHWVLLEDSERDCSGSLLVHDSARRANIILYS